MNDKHRRLSARAWLATSGIGQASPHEGAGYAKPVSKPAAAPTPTPAASKR